MPVRHAVRLGEAGAVQSEVGFGCGAEATTPGECDTRRAQRAQFSRTRQGGAEPPRPRRTAAGRFATPGLSRRSSTRRRARARPPTSRRIPRPSRPSATRRSATSEPSPRAARARSGPAPRQMHQVSVNTARRVMEDAGYRPPKVERRKHDHASRRPAQPHVALDFVQRYVHQATPFTDPHRRPLALRGRPGVDEGARRHGDRDFEEAVRATGSPRA